MFSVLWIHYLLWNSSQALCSSLQISSGHSSSRCWEAPWLSYQCRQVPAVLVFRCGSSSILWLWLLSISSRLVFNTVVRSLFCDCCCGHHSTRGRNVSCRDVFNNDLLQVLVQAYLLVHVHCLIFDTSLRATSSTMFKNSGHWEHYNHYCMRFNINIDLDVKY